MTADGPCCALCWLDGVWSAPVDCWPGFLMCVDHITEIIMGSGVTEQPTATVIDLAEMRAKLRPPPAPQPFIVALMDTLTNIDTVYAARRIPTDG